MNDLSLNTPERVARMLLSLDYPRDEVRAVIEAEWPGRSDYDVVIADAEELAARSKADVQRQIEQEGKAAVEAEHNLARTMHRG